MDPHRLSSSPDALDADPAGLFLTAGMPMRNIVNIGWFSPLYRQARALGADVLLSGIWGNMGLSWDGLRGLRGLARGGRWFSLLAELRRTAGFLGASPLRLAWRELLAPELPDAALAAVRRLRGRPPAGMFHDSAISPAFAAEWRAAERRETLGFGANRMLRGDGRALRVAMLTLMERQCDVPAAMREVTGLEIRAPLGDARLLEFCLAIPEEQYLRGGVTRFLARRVLADRLPAPVLDNRRRGAQCPEWFHRLNARRDEIAASVEALERSPLASRCLDLPRLKRLVEDWPADADAAQKRWTDYYPVLDRGLHVGRFLRWVEGGNA